MVLLALPLAYSDSPEARRALVRNTVASVLAFLSSCIIIGILAASSWGDDGAESHLRIDLILLDSTFNFAVVLLAASRPLREALCSRCNFKIGRGDQSSGGEHEGDEENDNDEEGKAEEKKEYRTENDQNRIAAGQRVLREVSHDCRRSVGGQSDRMLALRLESICSLNSAAKQSTGGGVRIQPDNWTPGQSARNCGDDQKVSSDQAAVMRAEN
eukprot:CAMPEP_0170193078 /NCGR_PEP_ID=MMETSP0040_2-20121228/56047_1 /TAXON_ID=641309 /ORGANISM="Lotharella oceanica, Strain CCMP622" /LENGTH=213 /DNA_ID=CAMNT_0010441621 /DNA_START=355 /DNA_END=996 /DNA_ORIENTATION=+